MKVEIVQASVEMCQELAQIKKQVWETTYRGIYPSSKLDNYNAQIEAEKFANIVCSANTHLYVAKVANKIVGYMAFGQSPRRNQAVTNELVLLSVLREYQGLGIGRQLFEFAKDCIARTGHTHLIVCCNKYNTSGQAFYAKMGCKVESIDDDNVDKSIPQVHFVYRY